MQNFIKKYQSKFEQNLFQHCNMFVTVGTQIETPRYYNFGEVYEKGNKYYLRIESTQTNRLFFDVEITKDEFHDLLFDTQNFWNDFKEFRNNFLSTNYPTIDLN